MNIKKIFTSMVFTLALVLLSTSAVSAETFNFSGTVGSTETDPFAGNPGSYLRHVGSPAPDGYNSVYQNAGPQVVCDPNNTATNFSGSIDMASVTVGENAAVGLVDKSLLENGYHGWFSGAYLFVNKISSSEVEIGVSDGANNGVFVQNSEIYTIPAEETVFNIDLTISNGEISLVVNGNDSITTSYGTIKSLDNLSNSGFYPEDEFWSKSFIGWDAESGNPNLPFDLTVSGCEVIYIDSIAPVSWIMSHGSGDVVSGTIDISGEVEDNVELTEYNLSLYPGSADLSDGLAHEELKLNDENWCIEDDSGIVTLSTRVFSGDLCTDWDTTNYPDGQYQIRLAAHDVPGNFDTSTTTQGGFSSVHIITVTLENGTVADQTAPAVSIDSPASGSSVEGQIDISGVVSDDVELSNYNLSLYPGSADLSDGLAHESLRLNDENWCTVNESGTVNLSNNFNGSFCANWDTANYLDGQYQIRLAAKDAADNFDPSNPFTGGTSSVHVISMTIDNEAPVVSVDSPLDGSIVSGLVDISGSVIDEVGLSEYNLSLYPGNVDLSDGQPYTDQRLNDENWCTVNESGTVSLFNDFIGNLCTDWDTSKYPNGDYQIRLSAKDSGGKSDLSSAGTGGNSSVHVINITLDNGISNKELCKKGGWETLTYPSFKNQGDCVSYIATDGKNEPDG